MYSARGKPMKTNENQKSTNHQPAAQKPFFGAGTEHAFFSAERAPSTPFFQPKAVSPSALQAKSATSEAEGITQPVVQLLPAFESEINNKEVQRSLFNSPQQLSASPIQAKLTIGEPGDKYEQEADRVASQVVEQINVPASAQSTQGRSVQRQEEQPEELQAKPEITILQRQEEKPEELQAKSTQQRAIAGGEASTDLTSAINSARGGGQAIADNIRKPMEVAFGADFSGVKVHTDSQSDQLNQSIQARAFTTGQDVFFRSGEYNPGSRGGQELLAHELTHVVQQSGDGVRAMTKELTQKDEVLEQAPKAEKETTVNPDVTVVSPFACSHLQSDIQQVPFIQRRLVPYKPNKKDPSDYDTEEKEAANKAEEVDKLVEKAFVEFKKGDYTGASDAQIALYIKRKFEFDKGTGTMHPSTAAGYVIEGKANSGIKGLGFQTQGTNVMPGTRPDVVIPLSSNKQALVDITASNSIGHIFSKKGNWTGHNDIPYVAESVYPSIDFTDVSATANLSEAQINQAKKLVEAGIIANELALKEWVEQQQEIYYNIQKDLRVKLLELYQHAINKNKSVSITGRSAVVWKSFGLNVDIESREQKFNVEDIFYEDVVESQRTYTVPTHLLQERYNFIEQQMKQMN
jgi:hypothetical protein